MNKQDMVECFARLSAAVDASCAETDNLRAENARLTEQVRVLRDGIASALRVLAENNIEQAWARLDNALKSTEPKP